MRKASAMIAAAGMAATGCATPACAEIVRTEAALTSKNFCWSSGRDSEQICPRLFLRLLLPQFDERQHSVRHSRDMVDRQGRHGDAQDRRGGTLIRRYEIDGDRVNELTGTLNVSRGGHIGDRFEHA